MRQAPPIEWRPVLLGGAVALGVTLLLSLSVTGGLGAVAAGIAAGGALAGALSTARGGFHGGLVGILWIAADALADPFRPVAGDAVADTAQTLLADAARLAIGVLAGWLGGMLRRR